MLDKAEYLEVRRGCRSWSAFDRAYYNWCPKLSGRKAGKNVIVSIASCHKHFFI